MGAGRVGLRSRFVLLLCAVVLLAQLGRMGLRELYYAPGPLPLTRDVVVPPGGTAAAALTLRQDGVISYPPIFRIAAWLTRRQGPIRAGEFTVPAHASLWQVLFILRFAPPVEHRVTIPEGLTAVQIAHILNAAAAADGSVAPPPEGSILPQTYDYVLGTPRPQILARAAMALQAALGPAWAGRDPSVPLASARQAVILASIVQVETPLPAELPKIAAVYENRLARGMRLQADPTVIYAASHGAAAAGRAIGRADLASPSPYNTYVNSGLPPGPICAPGLAAIQAVLHPEHDGDLYFVATGDGGHAFAQTYAGQLRNIAAARR